MSTLIKSLRLTIGDESQNGFKCQIGGEIYYASNFKFEFKQTAPGELTFYLSLTRLFEKANDAMFQMCAFAAGCSIELVAESSSNGLLSVFTNRNENLDGTICFKGFIVKMEAERSASSYIIKVTAKTQDYLMTLGKNYKSFENKTLKEIVEDVLSKYEGSVDAWVNPIDEKVLEYVVQYNESDYDFLKRLASTKNEWMYSDGTKFIFGKVEETEPIELTYLKGEIVNIDVKTKPINLNQNFVTRNYFYNDFEEYEPDITEFAIDHPLLSKIIENSKKYLFKSNKDILLASIGGNYDPSYTDIRVSESGDSSIKRKVWEAVSYDGTTYCAKLGLGRFLTIKNTFIGNVMHGRPLNDTDDEEILITEVTHYITKDRGYYNTFVGKPKSVVAPGYERIPNPVAQSDKATVVDNEDPELLGRVRVRFDWQKTYDDDEMVSPWLRIVHPYAGKFKGFSFIPEVGEEVVVQFFRNNPDMPYITGCLYNQEEQPDGAWLPDGNKDNPIKAIRTRNGHTIEIHDEGEDGYIRIYDNEKENYILTFSTDEKLIKLESTGNIELYAKNDIIMHAGHDINASADNDVFIAAGHDMQRTADNDIREYAGNDRSTSIDRNDSLTVSQNQFIRIEENKDEEVTHKLQITAENIRTEAKEKLLEYSSTHHMKASQDLAVNASNRIDIKASQVKTN